jgi:hypothetical protein
VSYLGGRTIVEIPAAFVPRSLWSGKPTGIDFLAASYLYPGVYVGIPLTVQGELYWNGGMPFVIAGSLILGLLFGLLARAGLGSPPGSGRFVLYAAAVPFTHAFLTRGLATMAEGLAFAMIGTAGAVYLLSRRWNVPWRRT